ncbi:MAG TPA: putative porin [Vicinamibacteria bacterium]|nr:putative porin [Vicinamibacteria bacterium]
MLTRWISGFLCVLGFVAPVRAVQEEEKPKAWYDRLDFAGDLRMRYEGFNWEGQFDEGRRDRLRYRFRVGFDIELTKSIRSGFRLRSGDPKDPVSDNQTFGGGLDKDGISLAEFYADFDITDSVSVIAGKFDHSDYWEVSDLHWDDDVVVEGAIQRFAIRSSEGALAQIDFSTYELVLEEFSSREDSWVLGFQARPTIRLDERNELIVGAGFDSFIRPQAVVDLSLAGELTGNDVTNLLDRSGRLVSDFDILNAFGIWNYRSSGSWPAKLLFFYYKNTGAGDEAGIDPFTGVRAVGSDNDTAYFARVEAGRYDALWRLLFRYTRYDSEPDALLYAYLQSDTGRSSNVAGHRVDVRIGMPARQYINVTWYNTRPKIGDDATMNRWQFDYVFRY